MFGGLDATLHLAEETLDPSRTVPKALMTTIGIGFFSGFVFSVAMAYCLPSLDTLTNELSVIRIPLLSYSFYYISEKLYLCFGLHDMNFLQSTHLQTMAHG